MKSTSQSKLTYEIIRSYLNGATRYEGTDENGLPLVIRHYEAGGKPYYEIERLVNGKYTFDVYYADQNTFTSDINRRAYEAGGYRERYAMRKGHRSAVNENGKTYYKWTYSKWDEYQDANGAMFDPERGVWIG